MEGRGQGWCKVSGEGETQQRAYEDKKIAWEIASRPLTPCPSSTQAMHYPHLEGKQQGRDRVKYGVVELRYA